MINTLKMGILTASMAATLAVAPLSFAQTTTPAQSVRHNIACDVKVGKINLLVAHTEAQHAKAKARHDRLNDWWHSIGKDKFIAKYGQANYDTLNGYMTTLHDTYGVPLQNDLQTYATDLKTLQSMANSGDCGTSGGAFATQLQTVKTDRSKVKTDLQNWRNYLNNTIRPFIRSLKGTATTPTPAQ